MEHQWNENDRGKPKYSGRNLSQCHFVHHKSYPGSNPGLRGERPATNRLSHGTALGVVLKQTVNSELVVVADVTRAMLPVLVRGNERLECTLCVEALQIFPRQ
jgi:hypothetical protein